MTYIDYMKKKRKDRPRIICHGNCFGWNEGDEFALGGEDDKYLYFNDVNDRWTAIEKSELGTGFDYK